MTDRVSAIMAAVATENNLSVQQMLTPSHARAIARPRQIAIALCREITKQSLPKLAQRFSLASSSDTTPMHHTTILWACKRTERLRQTDEAFANLYNRCAFKAETYLNDANYAQRARIDREIEATAETLRALEKRRADLVRARIGGPKATASGRAAA